MFWATVAVGLVTVYATAINYLLYRSQTDPEVIVYTKHDPNRSTIISLVIENIGKSVAYDIKFSFNQKIPKEAFGWEPIPKEKVKWMETGPLIRGIPSLPPGGKRELDWGQYVGLKSVIGEDSVVVTAQFKAKKPFGVDRTSCESKPLLDIASYDGTVANDVNEAKKIREELQKIEHTLKQIGSANHPIIIRQIEPFPENEADH